MPHHLFELSRHLLRGGVNVRRKRGKFVDWVRAERAVARIDVVREDIDTTQARRLFLSLPREPALLGLKAPCSLELSPGPLPLSPQL